MKVVLDTSCVLGFLKNRDQRQFDAMGRVFTAISNLELEAILIGHVVSEVVYVLGSVYGAHARETRTIVENLMKNPGVETEPGYFHETVLDLWPEHVRDYGDAVVAGAAKELTAQIMTFDARLLKEARALRIPCVVP